MSDIHPWEIEVAEVAVGYAPTLQLNFISTGYNFGPVHLIGDMVVADPVARLNSVGRFGHIRLIQDSAGNHSVTFGSNWNLIGAAGSTVGKRPFSTTILHYRVVTPTLIDYWFQEILGPFAWTGGDIPPMFQDLTSDDWQHNVGLYATPAVAFTNVFSLLAISDAGSSIFNVAGVTIARGVTVTIAYLNARATAVAQGPGKQDFKTVPVATSTAVARLAASLRINETASPAVATAAVGPLLGLFQNVSRAEAIATAHSVGLISPGNVTGSIALVTAIANNPLQYLVNKPGSSASAAAVARSLSLISDFTGIPVSVATAVSRSVSGDVKGNADDASAIAEARSPGDSIARGITGVSASASVNSSFSFSIGVLQAAASAGAQALSTTSVSASSAVGAGPVSTLPVGG